MSKKDRLKKESEKQMNLKRLADLEELEEKEEARHKESKAAKKYRRKAKRGYSSAVMIFFSILMLAAFFYSGFYYGGVTIVGSFESIAEFIPKKTALIMGIGDILMAVGLVLCFCRKFMLQALFCIPGSGAFMYSALKIIFDIQERMADVYVEDSIADMDKDYMRYYFPILVLTLFSLVNFTIQLVKTIRRKRREKYKRDTAPVESIVGADEE